MADQPKHVTYADAGVDVDEGARAVDCIKDAVKATNRPEVIGGLGGFGSCFSMKGFKDMEDPVLVSGTDGVGTKLAIAQLLDRHDTVGEDLVAMCVDDVVPIGAEPLFFLDYVAIGKLRAEHVAEIVKGIAEGCKKSGCALVGGEMAEHPGVMAKDDYDLAHIGGISYSKADNCIYAGLEDSKVWKYPVVAVYDADTLKFTGRYHILDNTRHTRGLPWVAVDNDNGLLIALDHSKNANELIFYNISDNMKYVKTVKLSETVRRIQGAEMYKGMLYAATNDDTQAIYKIDPVSGEVSKYFDRNLTKGSEGEGITVLETADGAVFHAIDMGPLFINAFIRSYAPVEEG